MFICKYCGKECKNQNSLTQHELRCRQNPNRLDLSYIKPGHSKGHKGMNGYIKAKMLGLPKPQISEETRRKISNSFGGKHHTEESKKKISEGIRKAIANHPESYNSSNVNGRVKHYEYNGFIMDGKWELKVARYLDNNNIKWIKPTNFFQYIWNGNIHKYFPDFYLVDYDIYIEVKGYERERDLMKYQVVDNLIVIKYDKISLIDKAIYNIYDDIEKLGK